MGRGGEVLDDYQDHHPFLLAGALAILPGCGEKVDEPPEEILPAYMEPTPEPSTSFAPVAFPTSVARSHNYDEVEDRIYYYIAAVSEEDRKRGKAAGSVFGYRYLGRNADGEHVLALVTGSGAVSQYSRCPNKCVVIHTSDGDRIAYTNTSIVGAAFEDAIGDRLKRWVPPRTEVPVYYDPPQVNETPQPRLGRWQPQRPGDPGFLIGDHSARSARCGGGVSRDSGE